MKKKNSEQFREVFDTNFENLEVLGLNKKISKATKEWHEDIITIFSKKVCNVNPRQVEYYAKKKTSPSAFRWGNIYYELLQKGKFINCDPDVKRDVLVTAGSALHHDPSFSLDDCRECKMCAYAESCRNNFVLYPNCRLAVSYFKFADDTVNLSLNCDARIKDIKRRQGGQSGQVFLTDSIADLVDAMYKFLEGSKEVDSPKIHRTHFDVLLKNASLLRQAEYLLWVFTPFDEGTVTNALERCENLVPKKTISQINSCREMAEKLFEFAKELEEVPQDADMIEVHDIAKMESFNNLTFLDAYFVVSNLLSLTCLKLRPVDVKLYAHLMQHFPEEDILLFFEETVSQKNA